eukprot:Pgem_evm1s10124
MHTKDEFRSALTLLQQQTQALEQERLNQANQMNALLGQLNNAQQTVADFKSQQQQQQMMYNQPQPQQQPGNRELLKKVNKPQEFKGDGRIVSTFRTQLALYTA